MVNAGQNRASRRRQSQQIVYAWISIDDHPTHMELCAGLPDNRPGTWLGRIARPPLLKRLSRIDASDTGRGVPPPLGDLGQSQGDRRAHGQCLFPTASHERGGGAEAMSLRP